MQAQSIVSSWVQNPLRLLLESLRVHYALASAPDLTHSAILRKESPVLELLLFCPIQDGIAVETEQIPMV